ncbi:interferon-induced very large GTPase 1-like [Onychostoma macrolepis]|uniref:interferon-induced very large GTPase 1-like n=1 Tax=Onychostoma macrolepis TaxID=369639 RepID=UPI00272C1600|nr:interferon-induced very large GTPase 1-like [Onychostoma macrolepis]
MVQKRPWLRLYAFPTIALLTGVLDRVRRDGVSLLLVAPFWPAQVWFSDIVSLLDGSPWETDSSRWRDCTSSPRTMEDIGVASEGAHLMDCSLSSEVKTILHSRALSMRKLYSLKWKLFTSWCGERQVDPVNCPLHLHDKYHQKLKAADFLQLTAQSGVIQSHNTCAEHDLVHMFLQRLLMMDYRTRHMTIEESNEQCYTQSISDLGRNEIDLFDDLFSELHLSNEERCKSGKIHPMDVQMAVFHCADSFLKQLMVTKLSQCQYALPLLVPDPFTQQLEFPLWTFRQINKNWNIKNNNEIITKTQPVCKAATPMVAFFRFGLVSSSKSELMNKLINEKHNTFFHRNCKGSSTTRVLMDGVVEIAWYCPSGKDTDTFTDCVAFCNLHGDAGDHDKQLNILAEMASVNVVLLPQLDRYDKNAMKIQMICQVTTPLIFLLTENNVTLSHIQNGKMKIGLKDRNQSEVMEELVRAINDGLSLSSTRSCSVFRLEDVARLSEIRVDEHDHDDCRTGKEKAQQMMSLLEKTDLTQSKELLLPCQGKLWHQWCQKNKELHRPQRNETEMDISVKNADLKKIRKQQHASDTSEFMTLFLKEMNTLNADEKVFFLKWLGILLDQRTSEVLSALHSKYNIKCSEVLKLKKNNVKPEQLAAEQTELKKISEDLHSANFGLVHILREIGQIYESCSSVKKNMHGLQCHFSSLPSLAAEIMISGFPLELMDGDASHVSLIWVTAVFDELVKKLGNLSVFVLSVLGIQSTGKSTLLNTMFGLQFAVSAGRCTRGAFMQLVKVSDEMKTQLKFDYILVVDTEGLCSLELSGMETTHHDNELATFVVGVGNVTLINIFGENPAGLQKILQIVVQAFLRMKNVKLNPSCIFVHQNVDIMAKEKIIQERMNLLEELDEMTELAAKDDVCDVQCFNEVIKFDALNDVKYFSELWEGNPPMAPPNPNYSENVKDLKDTIISQASKSDSMRLTHLKYRIEALWEALLNENFVFSFRDCLAIAVYRRLETEYSKWTWSLRFAMLEIENKLLNKIENGTIHEVLEHNLQAELRQISEEVNKSMSEYFEKDNDACILIQWRTSFKIKIKDVQENIVRETKKKLHEVLQQQHLKKRIDAQRTHHENTLFEKSKHSALKFKDSANNEETLKKEFNFFWHQQLADIKREMPPIKTIDVFRDMKHILSDIHESVPLDRIKGSECIDLASVSGYADYVVFKRSKKIFSSQSLDKENEDKIRALVAGIAQETDEMIKSKPISKMGYNIVYVQQLTDFIKKKVKEHEEGPVTYVFKKEFTMDLTFHIFKRANRTFTDLHRIFREANDPVLYFEKKKEEYYNIFQKYCQGATSSAIFGQFICNKLKEPIQQSVYKKTARDLANEMRSNCESLNGNRSKLEKHILKVLAEKENFDMYVTYIHNPRELFKTFIRDEVSKYISEKFNVSVLQKIKEGIKLHQQKIIEAAHEASKLVKVKNDVDSWLNHFTNQLSDVLMLSEKIFTGVSHNDVDINLLVDVIRRELPSVKFDSSRTFRLVNFLGKLDYKDRPDEILIDHLCQCCWVTCPFCKAICTNTIENHGGDHSVPFHRNVGLNGWYFSGTTNLSVDICTSEVASDHTFSRNASDTIAIPWREYRKGGPKYANWSITPDHSELPYWKWVVCRFQKDLENKYNKRFLESGKIPDEWRNYTKQEAIQSLSCLI